MAPIPPPTPRIITYYQTHHDPAGNFISILPLIREPGIEITHVNLAAIHINADPSALTLNDHAPSHPRFDTLWAELRVLQASGVRVLAMLGGAAQGTYARLDGDPAAFERYYAPLRDLLRDRALDGVDLDVEEPMSLAGIVRLIDRLRADFGRGFLLTLAPVAAALVDARRNLSGFDYEALEALRGRDIAWYHAQFYCGWGDCSNPLLFELMVRRGWPADRIVVGLVTNPDNGSGYVPWAALSRVLPLLLARHPGFGGVVGWEYFNALPGGTRKPWEWARWITGLLRGEKAAAPPPGALAEIARRGEKENASRALTVEAEAEQGHGEAAVPRDFDYYTDEEPATGDDN